MKKIVFLIMSWNFLFGFNFVIDTPIIEGVQNKSIVKYTINKGFERQVWDFQEAIKEKGYDIITKDMAYWKYFSYEPTYQRYVKADKEVKKELDNFITFVNSAVNQVDTSTDEELEDLELENDDLGNVSIKTSNLKQIEESVQKNNDFEGNFKTRIRKAKQLYGIEEEGFLMPFYVKVEKAKKRNRKGKLKIVINIKAVELLKPDLFFFEYFKPYRNGRRFFLDVRVYTITIDSDGEPNFEYKDAKGLNWKRNYRLIDAETGVLIRQIITAKTGVDIK